MVLSRYLLRNTNIYTSIILGKINLRIYLITINIIEFAFSNVIFMLYVCLDYINLSKLIEIL